MDVVASAQELVLEPCPMTPDIMEDLERRGLIIRLCPGKHVLPIAEGEAKGASIYESDPAFGPHKLITVAIDCPELRNFATHPDNEEFLLIGNPNNKPLYLPIALISRDELEKKIANGMVSPGDFVCLRVRYNDPEVSFFVMLAGTPHGECTANRPGSPATFFVTESRDLPQDLIDWDPYRIRIAEEE